MRNCASHVVRLVVVLIGLVSFLPLRAAGDAVLFRQLRIGAAVVSLPANWTTLDAEIPVWLHLHGAPAVVENGFAAIGARGILVNVTLPGLSKVYTDHFADPAVLARLMQEVEAALRVESAAKPWRLGRLTVSSFSAGFGGVRELLKQPAAFDRIATLIMADSIYCGYAGDPAQKRVDADSMAGFLRFARLAAEGKKRLLITHSSQVPPGYASTTETADYLIQKLEGARSFEPQDWPGGLRQVSQFSRGQLDIIGFEGAGPEDHMRHLRALGALYERAAPVALPKTAASLPELRAALETHLTQPRFHAAAWGVKIVSLDTGRTLYEHHADRLLSPASNSKLYTAALALTKLGGDYRIVTPILATRAPDAQGVVPGDVIVSGRGDPSWRSDAKRAEFWKIFDPFVAALQRAGVRRVTGDLVADATYFRGVPNGAGWTADDLNDYYGAEISAVSLEDNYVELRLAPAATVGAPGELAWLQPHAGLVLDNRLTTVAKGEPRRFEVVRLFGENVVHVFGQVPLGAAPFNEDVTVPRPAHWFAAALKEAVARAGIEVAGQARSVRWPDAPAASAAAVRLGEVASPPLRELVGAFLKPSQNLETDMIFAHVGETLRRAETPATRTSEQLGLEALREFLRTNNLCPDDVRFDEGSGLSRNNLTSANATTALLAFMARHAEGKAFADGLPVAGVDGTLRRRMKGTAAEGNVRAKTGTLRWAFSLSGYVTSAAGERLAFSAMLNRSVVPPGRNARDDLDGIAVLLAGFSARSAEGAKPAGE